MHFTDPPPFLRNSETSTTTGVTPRPRTCSCRRCETPPGMNTTFNIGGGTTSSGIGLGQFQDSTSTHNVLVNSTFLIELGDLANYDGAPKSALLLGIGLAGLTAKRRGV
jgi:hypothetical protein